MGMYTELHFNSRLREDVPESVIKVLKHMVASEAGYEIETPDHPLFKTTRWRFMLICSSYYFDADTKSTLRFDDIARQYYLCIRSNFKNYDDEIEKFLDWIDPYLDKASGDFLGFSRYEQSEDPVIIRKK